MRARRVQWRRVAAVAATACVVATGVVVVVPDRSGTYTSVAAATRQAAAIGCGVNPIALPDDRYEELCTDVLGGHLLAVRALRPMSSWRW